MEFLTGGKKDFSFELIGSGTFKSDELDDAGLQVLRKELNRCKACTHCQLICSEDHWKTHLKSKKHLDTVEEFLQTDQRTLPMNYLHGSTYFACHACECWEEDPFHFAAHLRLGDLHKTYRTVPAYCGWCYETFDPGRYGNNFKAHLDCVSHQKAIDARAGQKARNWEHEALEDTNGLWLGDKNLFPFTDPLSECHQMFRPLDLECGFGYLCALCNEVLDERPLRHRKRASHFEREFHFRWAKNARGWGKGCTPYEKEKGVRHMFLSPIEKSHEIEETLPLFEELFGFIGDTIVVSRPTILNT